MPLTDEYRLEKHVEVVEIVSVEDEDDGADDAPGEPSDQLVSVEQG